MVYIIALFSIALGAVGQFLLKIGANGLKGQGSLVSFVLNMFINPIILIALLCFGSSMIMWAFVLRKLELSRAYPMISLSYILIMLMSYLFLRESFPPIKLIGSFIIIIGILLINAA